MSDSNRKGPDNFALIIGAMKSGTTSLFEILAQHPEIAGASAKEPGYFADTDVFERGGDWYRSLWKWNPAEHRIALEASTAYSKHPATRGVAKRIAESEMGRFRFIYMMRDPIKQIPSHARHALYGGWGHSLDEGIPQYMMDIVKYAMQLDEYASYFPRTDLFLLTLEEFEAEPRICLQNICRFLGVSEDFSFSNDTERYNEGSVYEMPPLLAKLATSRLADQIKAIVPSSLWHGVRKLLGAKAGNQQPLGRYELSEEEREQVRAELAADRVRLQTEYGVDTDRYWK